MTLPAPTHEAAKAGAVEQRMESIPHHDAIEQVRLDRHARCQKLRTNDQTVSLIANLQVAATRDQLIADIPALARSHAGVPQDKCQLPRRDIRTATAAETPPDSEPSSSGAK